MDKKIYAERILSLQKRMRVDGIKAYVIPATDPHLSESYCDHFGCLRKYFCSFSGQDGTLLVTQDESFLYTDGRYWVAAEIELNNTPTKLVRDGKPGVPSLPEFVKRNELYPLGMDTSLFSIDSLREFYLDERHKIVDIDYSFLVEKRPTLPKEKIFKVKDSLLSKTLDERVEELLEKTWEEGAESLFLSALDEIGYVLGYRGKDIPYTPVFYSYLMISKDGSLDLFLDLDKLPEDFDRERIHAHPYEEVFSFLQKRAEKILIDPKKTNSKVYSTIKNKVLKTSPCYLVKAVKGPVEITHTKYVHELDGIAVLKLMKFLDDNLKDRDIDELEVCDFLKATRLLNPLCYDLSFATIAAVDSNGPMMHYEPTEKNHAPFTKDSLTLLVDSGGQYYGGTTDITRTFLGRFDKEVQHDFTLTLKSQIALSRVVFMRGCSGHAIDLSAREVMWRKGLDYKCGTGHGVAYMGPVHEGPIGFRYYTTKQRDDNGVLVPGHVITIEPGVYKTGKYGIRLENELLVVPAYESEDGSFLRFETITYCPYDRKGIDVTMLDESELTWLNDYLKTVEEKLAPHLANDPELLSFLKKQCEPFTR